MVSLMVGGTNNKLVIYTDNKNREHKVVISHIISYQKIGKIIQIDTPSGYIEAKFNTVPLANNAILLMDSLF